MSNNTAKIISGVFHPLLLPTYTLILMMRLDIYLIYSLPIRVLAVIGISIFIITVILPLIGIFILKKIKLVHSYQMPTREERYAPMLLVAICFYLAQYLLSSVLPNNIFNIFLLGATLAAVLSLLITLKWKISIHMIGSGCVFGTFLGLNIALGTYLPELIYAPLLLAGFIGSARLKLKAHTPLQVYVGFLLGSILMFSIFFILK
ncbi:MAG: hypothetical protein ACEPOW_00370 [Bacteroidales bacterium]